MTPKPPYNYSLHEIILVCLVAWLIAMLFGAGIVSWL